MEKPAICPLIETDLPEPYASIVKLLFYTVYSEDYIQVGSIDWSDITKNIVNAPAKMRSGLAKLLLLNEMVHPGTAANTVRKLPIAKVHAAHAEYKRRRDEYEKYRNAAATSNGSGTSDQGITG
jgi:hypothetical protein